MFEALTTGFYRFFRTMIRAAWERAKQDELAAIAAEIPGNVELTAVRRTLDGLTADADAVYTMPALPDKKPGRKS